MPEVELFQPGGAPPPVPPKYPVSLREAFVVAVLFAAACYFGAHIARPEIGGALAFAVCLFGAARVVIDSKVTKPVRLALGKLPVIGPALYTTNESGAGVSGLLTCYLCVGTWLGLGLALAGVRIVHDTSSLGLALNGAAGAALAIATHAAVSWLEAHYSEG